MFPTVPVRLSGDLYSSGSVGAFKGLSPDLLDRRAVLSQREGWGGREGEREKGRERQRERERGNKFRGSEFC